jgi:hypothetical protein
MSQVFCRVKGFFYRLGGHGLKLFKREAKLREVVHDKGNDAIAYAVPLLGGPVSDTTLVQFDYADNR